MSDLSRSWAVRWIVCGLLFSFWTQIWVCSSTLCVSVIPLKSPLHSSFKHLFLLGVYFQPQTSGWWYSQTPPNTQAEPRHGQVRTTFATLDRAPLFYIPTKHRHSFYRQWVLVSRYQRVTNLDWNAGDLHRECTFGGKFCTPVIGQMGFKQVLSRKWVPGHLEVHPTC